MPRRTMFPPLPESNKSERDRFRRFAKVLLAVPKSEIMPEDALAKLDAGKQKVETKLAYVRRVLAKRKAAKTKASSRP